ncbi:unnamed protein product [Aspergillus oryzae]|nr:unnamed protein product [Aspergillus oryzae]
MSGIAARITKPKPLHVTTTPTSSSIIGGSSLRISQDYIEGCCVRQSSKCLRICPPLGATGQCSTRYARNYPFPSVGVQLPWNHGQCLLESPHLSRSIAAVDLPQ